MYKNDVFLIKRSAHKILVEAYKQCDAELICRNFNYMAAVGDGCSEQNAQKCRVYLEDTCAIVIKGEYCNFKLTGKGIEIAEEIIFNSPPSPVKPKEQEPYKPNAVHIIGSDYIKTSGITRKFKAVFTDENSNPIEMSPLWSFDCDPSLKDHVSYTVSEDNTTCEIGAANIEKLIGTQVKLSVSNEDGTRRDEKVIDIVSAF